MANFMSCILCHNLKKKGIEQKLRYFTILMDYRDKHRLTSSQCPCTKWFEEDENQRPTLLPGLRGAPRTSQERWGLWGEIMAKWLLSSRWWPGLHAGQASGFQDGVGLGKATGLPPHSFKLRSVNFLRVSVTGIWLQINQKIASA